MKNIFNFKLFKEALKQIRIQFFLCLGVLLGIAGIAAFAIISDAMALYQFNETIEYISILETYVHLHIIYALVVPIFVMKLFKFLTKRNASDFYHAIPQKRICIFVTYSIAVIVASTVLLVAATIVPTIAFLCASKYIKISLIPLLTYVLNIFVCSLLTLAVMLLSSAMTGTSFTNVIFAIVILVGPRFIITLITESIASTFYGILPNNADFGIFSSKINLVWNQVHYMIEYEKNVIYQIGIPTLYTTILAVIYYLLAIKMFNKRRSEQAENSLNNPFAQHTIRICIGFVFSIFIALTLFDAKQYEIDNYVIFELLTYAFVAICGMTIFEMLSTKKAKNLLNVVKTIPVVAILCLLVVVILNIAENRILGYTPDASKVSYIRYSNGGRGFNSYDFYEDRDYYQYITSKIKFDDNELIEFVTEKYNAELENFNKLYNSSEYEHYSYYEYSQMLRKDYSITVEFKEGLTKTTRVIHLNQDEYNEFCELAYSNKTYLDARSSLPEDFSIQGNQSFLTNDEIYEVIEVFENEIKDLSLNELETVLTYNYYESDSIVTFSAQTYVDSAAYIFNIYINPTVPKTMNKYLEILNNNRNEQKDNLDTICNILSNINDYTSNGSYFDLNIRVYDIATSTQEYYYNFSAINENLDYETYRKDDIEGIKTLINECSDYSNAKYIIKFYIDYSIGDKYDDVSTYIFTDETELIDDLFEKINNTYR